MEFAVFIVFWLVARATLLTPNTLKYVGALQKRGDPDEFYVYQAALFRRYRCCLWPLTFTLSPRVNS